MGVSVNSERVTFETSDVESTSRNVEIKATLDGHVLHAMLPANSVQRFEAVIRSERVQAALYDEQAGWRLHVDGWRLDDDGKTYDECYVDIPVSEVEWNEPREFVLGSCPKFLQRILHREAVRTGFVGVEISDDWLALVTERGKVVAAVETDRPLMDRWIAAAEKLGMNPGNFTDLGVFDD